MRAVEVHELEVGTIITVWPASTGRGGEIYLPVRPSFVVLETGLYLVSTDTDARTVRFRLCAESGAPP